VELDVGLPSEWPANTLRVDTAWRIADGRGFHLEFQRPQEASLYHFLAYDARFAHTYATEAWTVVLDPGDSRWAASSVHLGTAVSWVENV